jgi:glycosyltransferase involved in cell wall biosynthesis
MFPATPGAALERGHAVTNTDVAFSIIVPCYNEAENLPVLVDSYRSVWRDLPSELVLVDNGSTDATPQVLRELLREPALSFVRTVVVPRNRGYGYGVMTGLREARGAVLGISHADMQCPAADLFRAYDKLMNTCAGAAMVKGRRQRRGVAATVLTTGMTMIASLVLWQPLADINAQPKVFPRSLLAQLQSPPDGFELDLYLLYRAKKLGFSIESIPVVFGQRAHGTSKWAYSLAARRRQIAKTLRYIFFLRSYERRSQE